MAAFIWDMDGTLVDSYPAIVPAVQKACAEFGIDLPYDEIYAQVIRTSVGAYLKEIAAEYRIDPSPIQTRFDILNDISSDLIKAEPHAKETLCLLLEAGHSNFVFTHRGASCLEILKNTSLLPYFKEVITALDGFPRKPSPDAILFLMKKYDLSPADCFYVGDRSLDIEAAINAGIGSILYLNPGSPGKATGKETHVIQDLMEIAELANRSSVPQ